MSLAPNCICGASFNYCVESPKCMRNFNFSVPPTLEPSIMRISLSNDEEILRFEKDGLIYYRNKPITEDKQIVNGFIEFLSAQGLYTKPDKSKKVEKKTKNKKIYKIRDKKTGKYLTSTFGKTMWARFPSEYINGRNFEYKTGDYVVDEFELNPINTYDLKGKLI